MKKFLVFLIILSTAAFGASTSDNNFSIGDGQGSNKTVTANKAFGTTNPKLRWNNGSTFWDFTNDGSVFNAIVGTGNTQTLTNKTMTSPEIDTPLIDDYFDINEESAPSTPASGKVRVYAKTDNKLYFKDDAGLETEIGGGGGTGSGEPNVVSDPYNATNWAASNTGITVATTTTSTDLPLEGISSSAIKITPVSGTDYVYYRWTMPAALKNKKLKAEWFQRPLSGYATGDLKFEVYKNSASNYAGSYTEFDLATDSSGTTSLPNATGKFTTIFDADDADYYELRFVRTAGTTAFNIAGVVVGPGIQPQGSVVSRMVSGSLSGSNFNNDGSLTITGSYAAQRVGDSLSLTLVAQFAGTGSEGGTLTYALPTDFGTITVPTGNYSGGISRIDNGTVTSRYPITVDVRATGASTISFGENDGSGSWTGTQMGDSGTLRDKLWVSVLLPVNEWTGSGTLNVAQNDVEYASVAGTWDADSSTTVYGSGGTLMGGALTATRLKTITWQTPVLPTDRIQVWASKDQITWVPINGAQIGSGNTNVIPSASSTGSGLSGVNIRGSSSTQTIIAFQRYPNAANDDSPADDWPSASAYWVATKARAGAAIGFGTVSSTSAGLMPANLSNLDNTAATRMGLKVYSHGGSYNGGNAPTITLFAGGGTLSSVTHSSFIPYQMQDGSWRMKFNYAVVLSSASRTSATLAVAGIDILGTSAIAAWSGSSSGAMNSATANTTTTRMTASYSTATTTDHYFSGDIGLNAKPTWAY